MKSSSAKIKLDRQLENSGHAETEPSIKMPEQKKYIQCYYIDELGFYRHLDPDRLHYVCSNLNSTNRDSSKARSYNERGYETYFKEIRNNLGISHFDRMEGYKEWKCGWDNFMKNKLTKQEPTTLNQDFKSRVRSGIPHDYRCKVWSAMIRMRTKEIRSKLGENIYSSVLKDLAIKYGQQIKLDDDSCGSDQATNKSGSSSCSIVSKDGDDTRLAVGAGKSQQAAPHQMEVFFKQIELDLLRTLPNNCHFESPNSRGIQRVRRILRAYALFNPTVGYCQGMNRLAAMALLVLPEEEAFWCLVAIIQCIMPKDYYLKPWLAQVDCCALNDLVEKKMPILHKHLTKNDIQLTLFTWFFTIFVDGFRPELMLRIWDCFLLEGDQVLFRFALAILYISQDSLMRMNDYSTMSSYLSRLVSTRKLDVEYLFDGKYSHPFLNACMSYANPD